MARGIGHALHLVLMGAALAVHPAGFLEVVVDVGATGLEFAQVGFGLSGSLVGLAQSGDLLAQPIEFLLRGQGGQALITQLLVALDQLVGQGLQLFPALGLLGGGCITAGQELSVEADAPHPLSISAVGECKPAQDLEQLAGCQHRVAGADWIAAMDGLVAEVFEQAEATHLVASQIAEDPRKHQVRQGLGGNRPLKLPIVVVHPLHQQLNGAAGVEAGSAGIT